jgi:hypothetical protein
MEVVTNFNQFFLVCYFLDHAYLEWTSFFLKTKVLNSISKEVSALKYIILTVVYNPDWYQWHTFFF